MFVYRQNVRTETENTLTLLCTSIIEPPAHLVLVAVDGEGGPALVAQGAGESVATLLGLDEDEHPPRVVMLLTVSGQTNVRFGSCSESCGIPGRFAEYSLSRV